MPNGYRTLVVLTMVPILCRSRISCGTTSGWDRRLSSAADSDGSCFDHGSGIGHCRRRVARRHRAAVSTSRQPCQPTMRNPAFGVAGSRQAAQHGQTGTRPPWFSRTCSRQKAALSGADSPVVEFSDMT